MTGAGELRPFLVILPTRSRIAFFEIQLLLRPGRAASTQDLDTVGTPHFAQFMPLEDNQIGFFTVYDGSFDNYIADFTKNIGDVFDMIFKFTKNPPPSPCRKHLQEFIDFAAGASRAPIGFYQAYPGLTVQDIHALIADSKASSGTGWRHRMNHSDTGGVPAANCSGAARHDAPPAGKPARVATLTTSRALSCAATGCRWCAISC